MAAHPIRALPFKDCVVWFNFFKLDLFCRKRMFWPAKFIVTPAIQYILNLNPYDEVGRYGNSC